MCPSASKPTGVWGILRARVLSFGLILGLAFLLMVSLVVSAGLAALGSWSTGLFPGWELLLQGSTRWSRMDSLIAASARALAAGDALGALKRVALRDDPPALACAASPWRSWASTRAPANCCGAPPAASARTRNWRARAAWWPRPRWRWPCATSAARRARWRRGGHAGGACRSRQRAAGAADRGAPAAAAGPAGRSRGRAGEARCARPAAALAAVAELAAAELALRSLRIGPAQRGAGARARGGERAGVPALLAEVAEARPRSTGPPPGA
jgi:hypothetical protein